MKKKIFVSVIVVSLLLGMVSSVLAHSSVKIFFNGEEVSSDVSPTMVKGRVLVPIRVITERLGALISWNEKRNSVDIDFKEMQAQKTRISLLENALAPQDPSDAAKKWAEGVKTRNGALQYAVMSPQLKKENYAGFVETNWSTGTSSSRVDSYQVNEKCKIDNETYRFEVKFSFTDAAKAAFTTTEYVTVQKSAGSWLISSLEKVDVKGKVTKLTLDGNKKIKSIFVESDTTEKTGYDKANVLIGSETKIYDGYTDRELTERVLEKGAEVEVTFTGDPVTKIYPVTAKAKIIRVKVEPKTASIVYRNDRYGFSFSLPGDWKGYTIVSDKWEGLAQDKANKNKVVESGPLLSIRHPRWTAREPRQDIPIMIFTSTQWNLLQQEKFHIGAAPMGPQEIARSSKYVFALPARYNYAFPTGYEEVEKILEGNPLQPFN